MGWLENEAKNRGHESLRAAAIAMRKSSRWPAGDERSAETIANKLRQADKGVDVRWWSGVGRALLPALAEILDDDPDELGDRLQREAAPSDAAAALWTFKLFPALRAIDLRSEPLFPGIPDEMVREGGPRAPRTWWVAPPGAGKTLVGRWLEARYGWTFLTAARWSEVELPAQGRVFIELGSVEGITLELLKALPPATKICVAALGRPRLTIDAHAELPSNRTELPMASRRVVPLPPRPSWVPLPSPPIWAGFQVVNPPPATTWLSDLVGWVTARVKSGGGFDSERVRKLFGTQAFPNLFETPGEVLGFLGMMDEVGVDEVESVQRRPQRWIRSWLHAMMERSDRAHAAGTAELLRRKGDEILVEMELARLRRGLEPALLPQDWAALIPDESAPPLDRARLLALADSKADDALAQIRVMLAPDRASLVQGFRAAGVLDDAGADRLVVRPTWVASTLARVAIDRLHRSGPEGLGTLLLFPSTVEHALAQLIHEVSTGDTARIAACAMVTGLRTPEQMAALDGAFRAVGLALLAGADVPGALILAIWKQQMSFVAARFLTWPAQPVLSVAVVNPGRGVTSPSAWFLAAFAISRALFQRGVVLADSALNPWHDLPQPPDELARCMEALVSIAMVFGLSEEAALRDVRQLAIYALGGDLLDRYGVLRHRGPSLLDIQAPDLLVELAQGRTHDVSDAERSQLVQLAFGLPALEDACRRRGVAMDRVLTWCWSQWTTVHPCPPIAWLRRTGDDATLDAKRLWSVAPAAAVSGAIYDAVLTHVEIGAWLTEPFWVRWLELWGADPGRWHKDAAPFEWIPEAGVLQALRDRRIDASCHDVRAVLWRRMPDALLALIDELADAPATAAPDAHGNAGLVWELVYSAPERHLPALIARVQRWACAPERYPGISACWQPWLMHVIQQRASGWRDAYETVIAHAVAPRA